MIKYNLLCKCGKTFESWFLNSKEYDSLRVKKLIKCIYCDSSIVKKAVMAPNLPSKSNKVLKKNKLENCDFRKFHGFSGFSQFFLQKTVHFSKKSFSKTRNPILKILKLENSNLVLHQHVKYEPHRATATV